MTLLTLIQDTAEILGVRKPDSVIGATDKTTTQLLALSNFGGKALATLNFPILEREITITTTGAELQGDLDELCGEEVAGVIGDTLYNSSEKRKIHGSKTIEAWKCIENSVNGTGDRWFRVAVNPVTNKMALFIRPAPSVGLTVRFAIRSKCWCTGDAGRAIKWASDEDTGIIGETVLQADLIWRWKQAKKLDYAEEFRTCQEMIEAELGEQVSAEVIELGCSPVVGDGFPLGPDESWVT